MWWWCQWRNDKAIERGKVGTLGKNLLVFPLLPFGMAWVAEAHGLLLMLMGDDSTRLGDRVSQYLVSFRSRGVFLRVFTKRKPLRKVAEAGGKGKHLHLRRGVHFFFRDTVCLAWTRPHLLHERLSTNIRVVKPRGPRKAVDEDHWNSGSP